MEEILEDIATLEREANCNIILTLYLADFRLNVQIDDCETKEHCSCDVNWEWSEYEILKTIADAIEKMKARPKCFNCKHYHPDPGFFEICGCDCNNFSKYEDKNKVVTFNEF